MLVIAWTSGAQEQPRRYGAGGHVATVSVAAAAAPAPSAAAPETLAARLRRLRRLADTPKRPPGVDR